HHLKNPKGNTSETASNESNSNNSIVSYTVEENNKFNFNEVKYFIAFSRNFLQDQDDRDLEDEEKLKVGSEAVDNNENESHCQIHRDPEEQDYYDDNVGSSGSGYDNDARSSERTYSVRINGIVDVPFGPD
ncbi:10333_t:CDS:2, partial [Funneliformis caledonium]